MKTLDKWLPILLVTLALCALLLAFSESVDVVETFRRPYSVSDSATQEK